MPKINVEAKELYIEVLVRCPNCEAEWNVQIHDCTNIEEAKEKIENTECFVCDETSSFNTF